MICPGCQSPLITGELDAVEVDFCASCKGVWLDAGELELLFGDAAQCEAFLDGGEAAATEEKPRKCPVCHARMAKRRTRGEAEIVFDRCERNHGLWLDEGELTEILRHAPAVTGGATVHRFLRDVFGYTGEGE